VSEKDREFYGQILDDPPPHYRGLELESMGYRGRSVVSASDVAVDIIWRALLEKERNLCDEDRKVVWF
jgi:hypothetical protein